MPSLSSNSQCEFQVLLVHQLAAHLTATITFATWAKVCKLPAHLINSEHPKSLFNRHFHHQPFERRHIAKGPSAQINSPEIHRSEGSNNTSVILQDWDTET